MTKEILIDMLVEASGNRRFTSRPVLCRFFGISYKTCQKWLRDVEPIQDKLYYIPEVADAILDSNGGGIDE